MWSSSEPVVSDQHVSDHVALDSPSLRDREEKLYHFEKRLAELNAKFLL